MLREKREIFLALVAYVAVTVVVFWPLLVNLFSTTITPNFVVTIHPGVLPGRDRFHFIWNFWWVGNSLISHASGLSTNLFYYPTGTSLALQTIDFVDGVISWILSPVIGEIAAYNIITIISFPLAGFSLFMLARHFTRSFIACFGGGLIFAFFPQHFNQAAAGHPNISSVEFLPALLLALILTYEKTSYKYALLTGIFLTILTLIDPEQMILGLLVIVVYLVYYLIGARLANLRSFVLLLLTMVGVWLATSGAYLYSVYEATKQGIHAIPPITEAYGNAAKPLLYLIPPPSSIFYGSFFGSEYSLLSPIVQVLPGGPSQWVIFIGYSALSLAIIGAVTSKNRLRYYLLLIAILAFVASLGPLSDPSSPLSFLQIPYTFLYNHFSILQFFRAEARFSILLMMAIGVLAAFGISTIIKLVDSTTGKLRPYRGKIIGIFLLGLIMLEFAPVVDLAPVQVDPAYNIIANDHSNFAVLELPATISIVQEGLYAQTIYHKPLIDGKISQSGVLLPSYMFNQLFLRTLSRSVNSTSTLLVQPYNDVELGPIVLSMYHIKYIIVHFGLLTTEQYNVTIGTLYEVLGSPIYQDSNVMMFSLQNWVSTNSIVQLAQSYPITLYGPGWSTGASQRTVNSFAQLMVYSGVPSMFDMIMTSTAMPCFKNTNSSQPTTCGTYDPGTGLSSNQIWLNPGLNIVNVSFESLSANVSSIKFVNATY
jgi:hypothetical protein